MSPFDLERAKAGHPVVTRDGRKARIAFFDLKHPNGCIILAAVESWGSEDPCIYNAAGRFWMNGHEDYRDLCMA